MEQTDSGRDRQQDPAIFASAAVPFGIALVVLYGWYAPSPALVQWLPGAVAMQFNTALSLLLLSVATFTLQHYQRAGIVLALSGMLLPALNAVEYLIDRSFIDQMLWSFGIDRSMEPYVVSAVAAPGRMALNTVLALTLTGTSLLFSSTSSRTLLMAGALMAAAVSALGTVGLAAYIGGQPSPVGWGGITRMAVHTAVAVMSLGFAAYELNRRRPRRLHAQPADLASATLGVIAFIATFALLKASADRAAFELHHSMWPGVLVGALLTLLILQLVRTSRLARQRADQLAQANEQLRLDIERRELAEAALRQSEAEMRALMSALPDVLLVLDRRGRYLQVGQSSANLLYRPASDLLGRTIHEVLPAENAQDVQQVIERVLESGQQQELDYALPIAGREVWFAGVVSPRDADSVFWIARDITSRKEAERALAESEMRFRQLAENVDQVFWLTALDGQEVHYISPAYERVFGVPAEELYRDPGSASRFVLEQDLPLLLDAIAAARAGRESVIEYRIRRKDGELRWLRTAATPIRDSAGHVYRLAGVTTDITESREAQEALRKSQRTLRNVLAASPDVVEMLDAEGRFIWISEAITDALGYHHDTLRGTLMADLLNAADAERFHHEFARLLAGQSDQLRLRYKARHADGHWVPLEGHGRLILSDGRPELVFVVRDISQQARLEANLLSAKSEAESANRAKSDFLSRMSHELRTPLNSILGFGQLLELADLPEEDRESVDQIMRAARHLLQLINEVLDIARIESGAFPISLEPVEVESVIDDAVKLVRPLADQRHIEIRVLAHRQFAHADQQRLKQVLLNLLSNAIKFNRVGGDVLVKSNSAEDGVVRISVTDAGPGIAPAQLEKLFQPFQRFSADIDGIEGTGLGLALSRGLVELMGGKIAVTSSDRGSTFVVELAASEPPSLQPGLHAPGAVRGLEVDQPLHILYIEDNLANLRVIQRLLRGGSQLRLTSATRGREGVELAVEEQPDLVLLDINLPDIPGDEVLSMLRRNERTRRIPVIVVSADANPATIERLMDAGAAAYLTKPVDAAELFAAVKRTIEHTSVSYEGDDTKSGRG